MRAIMLMRTHKTDMETRSQLVVSVARIRIKEISLRTMINVNHMDFFNVLLITTFSFFPDVYYYFGDEGGAMVRSRVVAKDVRVMYALVNFYLVCSCCQL